MDIKINLKQLTALFIQSAANEELPKSIRQFAAQLTVLAAHVERVDAKINAEIKVRETQIAELATIMGSLPDAVIARLRTPTDAPPTTATSPAPTNETEAPVDDEDAEAEEMAARVIAETEAEVAAITKTPPAAVTPLRKQNAGSTTKEAS